MHAKSAQTCHFYAKNHQIQSNFNTFEIIWGEKGVRRGGGEGKGVNGYVKVEEKIGKCINNEYNWFHTGCFKKSFDVGAYFFTFNS